MQREGENLPLGKWFYIHFKGKDYKVLYIAKDANTGEDIVVYRGNYGNCPVFVRPIRNFNDFVERNGYRGRDSRKSSIEEEWRWTTWNCLAPGYKH